jgi:hypothetical protein
MEGKMSETNEQEEMKTNELAGMQFANVELTLSEMQTGPITHLADESGSNSGLGQLAKLGAEGFSLVAVTPKENGRALAFLQRPVQTERELNFIRNAFLLARTDRVPHAQKPASCGSCSGTCPPSSQVADSLQRGQSAIKRLTARFSSTDQKISPLFVFTKTYQRIMIC